ncbi:hypothetical protein HN011_000036, partial [Eciton burchellii]
LEIDKKKDAPRLSDYKPSIARDRNRSSIAQNANDLGHEQSRIALIARIVEEGALLLHRAIYRSHKKVPKPRFVQFLARRCHVSPLHAKSITIGFAFYANTRTVTRRSSSLRADAYSSQENIRVTILECP